MPKAKAVDYSDDALIDFLADIMDEERRSIIFQPDVFSQWWQDKIGWNNGGATDAQKEWGERTLDALSQRAQRERVRVEHVTTRTGREIIRTRVGGRFASIASALVRLFGGK